MDFIQNGVKTLKRHSIANISDVIRNHRHRDSISSLNRVRFPPNNSHKQLKNVHFESVSAAVVHMFQKKKLQENELSSLQESVRTLLTTDAGPLVYDYYKDKLIKKGMVILRERIKNETGDELLTKLGEQWDYFYTEILPVLQSLLHPIKTKHMTIRQVTLIEFRNTVLLKLPVSDAINQTIGVNNPMPPAVQQMLLVLQNINDRPVTENALLLENMVARVISPYLGMMGLYNGGTEPEVRSNYKPPSSIPVPVIFTSNVESDSDEETIPTEHHKSKRQSLSPLVTSSPNMHRLHHKRSSGLLHHPLLAAVKEHDRGQIRRYSIATS